MRVLEDHWVEGVRREPVLKTRAAMQTRRFLVIHYTAGMSAMSSIEHWRRPSVQASAHFVIDRDGTIFQCVPCNVQAWHAGESAWTDPRTGKRYRGLNGCSIGIELANAGNEVTGSRSAPLLFGKYRAAGVAYEGRHKNGGPVKLWEQYPEAQLASCSELAAVLVARYNLDDVVGHDDIAPERKPDPGPAFPMEEFRAALGFPAALGVRS